MDQSEAINKVKQYKSLLSEHIMFEKVYIYGSYATDNQHDDSDIDVAIVVDQILGEYFSTVPLLWRLRRQVDDRIEPILIQKENDKSGFLSEIIKSGLEIT